MRYERKFRIEGVLHQLLIQQVRCLPQGFSPAFPDRLVQNQYYDTPRLGAMAANLDGLAARRKVRLRWYDPPGLFEGVLEIKEKRSYLGWKDSTKIDLTRFKGREALNAFVNSQTTGGAYLQPTLRNRYLRSYFISADGCFRITIDREICYLDQRAYPADRKLKTLLDPPEHRWKRVPEIILEIKYSREMEAEADRLCQGLPYRMSRYSKYVSGMEATGTRL